MIFMTPKQLATLSRLHKGQTESITIQRAHLDPGNILVTYWLQGGKFREVTITPEGGQE